MICQEAPNPSICQDLQSPQRKQRPSLQPEAGETSQPLLNSQVQREQNKSMTKKNYFTLLRVVEDCMPGDLCVIFHRGSYTCGFSAIVLPFVLFSFYSNILGSGGSFGSFCVTKRSSG